MRQCTEKHTRWGYVPDHLKTEKMCKKAVKKDSWSLKYVPDWFVMHQKILRIMKPIIDRRCMFLHNDDDLIKWYEGYKKQKTQKAQIKEELLPIAWHPSRYCDLCMSEDEKKETEKFFFDHLICVLSIRLSKRFPQNI